MLRAGRPGFYFHEGQNFVLPLCMQTSCGTPPSFCPTRVKRGGREAECQVCTIQSSGHDVALRRRDNFPVETVLRKLPG